MTRAELVPMTIALASAMASGIVLGAAWSPITRPEAHPLRAVLVEYSRPMERQL